MQLTTAQKHKQNVFGKNFPKIGNRSGKVDAVWKTVDKQQQKLCDFGKKKKWQKNWGRVEEKKVKWGKMSKPKKKNILINQIYTHFYTVF